MSKDWTACNGPELPHRPVPPGEVRPCPICGQLIRIGDDGRLKPHRKFSLATKRNDYRRKQKKET